MTEQVSDNCHQCAALRILPKVLTQDKIEQIPGFGSNFAADVIERSSQKILIVKEKISQFFLAASSQTIEENYDLIGLPDDA